NGDVTHQRQADADPPWSAASGEQLIGQCPGLFGDSQRWFDLGKISAECGETLRPPISWHLQGITQPRVLQIELFLVLYFLIQDLSGDDAGRVIKRGRHP